MSEIAVYIVPVAPAGQYINIMGWPPLGFSSYRIVPHPTAAAPHPASEAILS